MRNVLTSSVIGLLCLISATAQSVAESESRIIFAEKTAELSLVIEKKDKRSEHRLQTEFLAPDGTIIAPYTQIVRLDPGKRNYIIKIPIGSLLSVAGDAISWYRLRYRLGNTEGIISVSELLSDDFELRASAFSRVVPGESMMVRVRALNPFTEKAVKDVLVNVALEIDLRADPGDKKLKLKAASRTNGSGIATLEFKIPEDARPDGEGEIKIIGQKNGVVRKIEEDLEDQTPRGLVYLTTDKPLYQPGQIFNVRALYFDANNTVVTDRELEFSIEDAEDTVVFRQKIETSDFGIAAISWPIPDNAKLGTYRVRVEADEELSETQLDFTVSRYDLPNFAVAAKPDKTFYLPAETTAHVTVNADYLFGKPVTNGKVRVVSRGERTWNGSKGEYEYEEGEAIEGATDSNGKYVADIDIRDELRDLLASEWRRFEDLSFTAYFTDLSTNRTEQRRFDIRLSKEPVHIYLIRYPYAHPDMPITAYVSTFYADGTPAICNIDITDRERVAAKLKTNSLGAGKFEISFPKREIRNDEYEISITARDKKGQIGTFEETFDFGDGDAMQIRTDRTIYSRGDMIEVELLSTRKNGYVFVDITKDWVPLESRLVKLSNGRASVTIPYKPSFKGDLTITAYGDRESERYSGAMIAGRGVIFPEQQNLILNAAFSKREYRPGEDASVKFSVTDGSRKPVASAIGLSIFDKAIEGRARTDAEFGGYFSPFSRLLGYEKSFGNLTMKDLNELDPSRPVKPEIELAAEIMLAGNWYWPSIYRSGDLRGEAKTLYSESVTKQLEVLKTSLNERYAKDGDHPTDITSLNRILGDVGIGFDKIRDPWGEPYSAEFSVEKTQDITTLRTFGPDKTSGTPDDFVAMTAGFNYFSRIGEKIDNAHLRYRSTTSRYIRDRDTLSTELGRDGIDITSIRDRWGRDYIFNFEVSGRSYVTRITSAGPNGIYEPQTWRTDDFDVWRTSTDYFADTEKDINRILDDEVNQKKKSFPRGEKEFIEMLDKNGLQVASIRDGYGQPVYLAAYIQPRYGDKTKVFNGKTEITPVSEELMVIKVRSRGGDGIDNSNDFDLATFSSVITESSKGLGFSRTDVHTTSFSGAKGAIKGTIVDPNGAVITGIKVSAIDEDDSSKEYSAETDQQGSFLIGNLPSGIYRVVVSGGGTGFKSATIAGIQVRSQTLVEVNVTLSIGSAAETVDVSSGTEARVDSANSSVRTTVKATNTRIQFPYHEHISTPRLREYFPETLVWKPEVVTDSKGRANVDFKMADNITTWKMFAVASTKKGKIGVTEKEITAFQPFFVDLDPPKFLTEGDEISLPTQVRNYTDKKQRVDVMMTKSDWFSFIGSDRQRVEVEVGASTDSVFGFKATMPVKDGKQRVTAISQSDSDAIEKAVSVRPNGQEIVRTDSRVFNGDTVFDVNFPANALPKTQKSELKIYPNLFAHVSDSVEGLLQRPYGCGEQTISSTYPNLMILKFVKADSPLRKKAQKYLQKGYERLLGYQIADGGFTYWGGKDTSDVALTAYALRFLNDAMSQISVDEEVVKKAEDWLIKQQRSDGSWTKKYYYERNEDPTRTDLTTTYVARSLAMRKGSKKDALGKALQYLKTRNTKIDEPYALALFGLASLDAGDVETAWATAKQLEQMAIPEGAAVFWNLETNTPFYGWGTAGRIETTALVLQLLIRDSAAPKNVTRKELISKATTFLLKNKDRYGVWYSTQTTINVLDGLLAALATKSNTAEQTIEVVVGGDVYRKLAAPPDQIEPLIVDLTSKLNANVNRVEVRGSDAAPVMAQIVSTHYIDWRDSDPSGKNANSSRALRLDYRCNQLAPAIMEEVTCSVEAERIGFRGYGMLLAEIGTPPGADIDRESLENAIEADWNISRYEILPDRIVIYLWAKPGGTKFQFKFRPRYGINAQTPPSVVYDYYNPDAQATLSPIRFLVKKEVN